jgi:hypothetical protein
MLNFWYERKTTGAGMQEDAINEREEELKKPRSQNEGCGERKGLSWRGAGWMILRIATC